MHRPAKALEISALDRSLASYCTKQHKLLISQLCARPPVNLAGSPHQKARSL